MKRYFFKTLLTFLAVIIGVLALVYAFMATSFAIGQKQWMKQSFNDYASSLLHLVQEAQSSSQALSGKDLRILLAGSVTDRISGLVIKETNSPYIFSLGKNPNGTTFKFMQASFAIDLMNSEGIPIQSSRVQSSSPAPENKLAYAGIVANMSLSISNLDRTVSSKADGTRDIDDFLSDSSDFKQSLIGIITINIDDYEYAQVGVVAHTPFTYKNSSEIISNLLSSLLLILPVSIFLSLVLAWSLSYRNTKLIAQIRQSLDELAKGKEDVDVPELSDSFLEQISQSIKDLDKQLQTSKRNKNLWLRNISHDLNTPLTSIKIIVDGLKDGMFQPSGEILESLDKETEDLRKRIASIMTLTTLQTQASVNIGSILSMDLVAQANRSMDQRVVPEIETERLIGDIELLETAVWELLKNALENSSDEVHLKISKDESNYLISVINSGSLERQDDLFEPWTRGDQSRTKGGSGMGLAIVRQVMSLHEGTSQIEQSEGKVIATLKWPIDIMQR
ncbi:MAG: HAMP domain-containing sensor histidine kinase [Sphaerochaetaceae bacterium]|jgi:signal transduction histidine kinase|nr:HAMP domain-containing sensor histidine kinase [Sphaerochaetaceae bacterium]